MSQAIRDAYRKLEQLEQQQREHERWRAEHAVEIENQRADELIARLRQEQQPLDYETALDRWRRENEIFREQQQEREIELRREDEQQRQALYAQREPAPQEQWNADVSRWRAARSQRLDDIMIKKDMNSDLPTDTVDMIMTVVGEEIAAIVGRLETRLTHLETRITAVEKARSDVAAATE